MPKSISPYREKTQPITVANTGFLLDRLGENCHPLQFLRELTQNSIESILRTPEQQGEIVWDVEWKYLTDNGYYKVCITDNGDGMTGENMVKYINQLSSSIAEQSFMGNYGVGAKIAAATRNHAGMIYLSWQDGKGTMIHFWRDPESEVYGLRQFQQDEDSYQHYAEIEDDIKPEKIAEHGTRVVLLGMDENSDTMNAPPGSASPSRWISKYLNTRYFKFPEGITVKAREGWTQPRSDTDKNILRTITGQEEYLTKHSSASGIRRLKGAIAHWWVLNDDKALSQNSGFAESAGHVAALYRNELYELQTARSGMARLQQFGAILGYKRVVIYLEPLASDTQRVTSNTARTHLLINNAPLPWADWAAEFREKMPREILEVVKEFAVDSTGDDTAKSIRERLKQIVDLFKVSRYKASTTGSVSIDLDAAARGGKSRSPDYTPKSGAKGSGKTGAAGGAYSAYLKKDGVPGEEVAPGEAFPVPEVKWVSTKDGSRVSPDLEDRAGKFLMDQNQLLINADFRVFTDMINRFNKELGGSPGVNDIVTKAVQTWFQQTLMETVMGLQPLQKSKEWTTDDIVTATSEEALTAAVMPRWHVYKAVKRELGSKLGRLQDKIEEE